MTLGRCIVIGSTGQVAKSLFFALRNQPLTMTSSSGGAGAMALDLGSSQSIKKFFQEVSSEPSEVFLTGALTHVDRCETDRELCHSINSVGPGIVAEECARRGHKLTFYSTEYVFGEDEYHGGAVGPYSETDKPNPTSYYGKCKLEGEQRVLAAMKDALVIRTTMVFSWAPGGKNFLMQYLEQLENIRKGGSPSPIPIPEDQISTPTYASALADATKLLREKGVGGVINLAGSDLLSRRELVSKVIRAFGYDEERSLKGFKFLKTAEIGQKAKRPLTAGLTTHKAKSLGVRILSLDDAFALARNEKESAR